LSFRDAHRHLRDIQTGIDHIDAFLANMDFAAYQSDLKTRSAVERQLQIITEAAIRLGDEADSVCPGPDWKGLARDGELSQTRLPPGRRQDRMGDAATGSATAQGRCSTRLDSALAFASAVSSGRLRASFT
jgi:hypothetical protein